MQDAFDPAGVQFKTFPTMAKHLLKQCCQNMMQRYTSALYMNVSGFSLKCAYMTYFAF